MNGKDRIRQFITGNFYVPPDQELADDASLLDNGIVDSTGILELISFLEQQFEIEIEDTELLPENLDSIDRISAFVARKGRSA